MQRRTLAAVSVTNIHSVLDYASAHPAYGISAGVVVVLTAGVPLWRTVKGQRADDVLTIVCAVIATGMAAQGMWNVVSDSLRMPVLIQAGSFAVFELAMFTAALRARRNTREFGSAGVEGIAVWVLGGLSAFLSATDAGNLRGGLVRLAVPILAAWLWERGMAIERRRSGPDRRARVHWRITPERVLVWLGLAEATDRDVRAVDAHRRLTRLARAAKKVRTVRATEASGRRQRRALARLESAMSAAVEHTELATDRDRQDELLGQIGALYNAAALAEMSVRAPWDRHVHSDAVTPAPTIIPASAEIAPAQAITRRRGGEGQDVNGKGSGDSTEDPGQAPTRPSSPTDIATGGMPEVNDDETPVGTRERARLVLSERPSMTGRELAAVLGVSERHGQRIASEIRGELWSANGHSPQR